MCCGKFGYRHRFMIVRRDRRVDCCGFWATRLFGGLKSLLELGFPGINKLRKAISEELI